MRAIFGQMADEALLASARVLPARLEAAGFRFSVPELGAALGEALR
jgi:NAD dependent epimerase/dehydratase family enzyme